MALIPLKQLKIVTSFIPRYQFHVTSRIRFESDVVLQLWQQRFLCSDPNKQQTFAADRTLHDTALKL